MMANSPYSTDSDLKMNLQIEGMTCASCVGRVETALKKVDGVKDAVVNLATERADISLDKPIQRQQLIQAVEQVGYDVIDEKIEFSIDGMTCASCVSRVEKALKAVDGVKEAVVNLATERATVSGHASVDALIAAIDRVGYDAKQIQNAVPNQTQHLEKKTKNEVN